MSRAVPLFELHNEIYEKAGAKKNLAAGLGNVAIEQLKIGALEQAEGNLRRRLELSREIEDERSEAIGHRELGRTLSYRGEWAEAEQELTSGLELFEKQQNVQSKGLVWAYRALRSLLLAQDDPKVATNNLHSALTSATRALELADEYARTYAPTPRDYVDAYWLLGAAHRGISDLSIAEKHITKALEICRSINSVDAEANILLELSKIRHAKGGSAEALRLAQEALTITERSGYVLQGADVHLFLAELALEGLKIPGEEEMSDHEAAKLHAQKALELATCDGPPYYYKIAYEEAQRLLEKLKE